MTPHEGSSSTVEDDRRDADSAVPRAALGRGGPTGVATDGTVGVALVLGARTGLSLRRMGDSNSRGLAPNPLSKRAP